MTYLRWLTVLMVVVMSCGLAAAEPLPREFRASDTNGSGKPTTKDGITTFQIFDGQCSDRNYDDDRAESDCDNGNIRSSIGHGQDNRMGESVEYRFDVQVNADFAYPGYFNSHANGFYPGSWDSRLRIASWEGPLLHNFLYMLKLDTRNGMSFLARPCQTPDQFGQWVTFSMKIRWAADTKGWIKVTCDDRLVYLDENVATDQSPHCFITNVCEPDIVKHPTRVHMILGPVMAGFGYEWKKYGKASPFTPIQDNGITVKMRNIAITKGAVLYEAADKAAVRMLQERLAELGCEPGPADGVAGQKTRDAAFSCRQFPDGQLPDKLTVATIQTFLDAYGAASAADLPLPGSDLPSTDVEVRVSGIQSKLRGADINADSFLRAESDALAGPLDFSIAGRFATQPQLFASLSFTVDLDLDAGQIEAVMACGGVPVQQVKLGGNKTEVTVTRATFRMKLSGTTYGFPKADCTLAALPAKAQARVVFLLDHFQDIAIGIVRGRQLTAFDHDGVEAFLIRVANGELTVAR